MSITRHIQSVLRDNPGRSWNDLVHSTLLQRLSATTGTVSDLWTRWLNRRGYPYSSLSDMLQAYWNRLNVPTEERNYFTLGWLELFSTPLPLFSNGEQGAWYDPSDLSTLFQDSAGTTPVTALGQPVGRILDKRQGLALGADFKASGTTQLIGSATAAAYNTSTGIATVHRGIDVGNQSFIQFSGLAAGTTYILRLSSVSGTAAGVAVRQDNAAGPIAGAVNNGATASIYATAPASGILCLTTNGPNNVNTTFTLESIRTIAGNHLTQTTAASRPTLEARVNLLTNSGFAGAVAGTPGTAPTLWGFSGNTGTTVSANESDGAGGFVWSVSATAGRQFIAQTSPVLEANGVFDLTVALESTSGLELQQIVTAISLPAGASLQHLSDGAVVGANSIPTAGSRIGVRITISSTAGTATVRFGVGCQSNVTGSAALSRASLVTFADRAMPYQRVTTATDYADVGAPRYLAFDGVDDFLTIGTFNMSASDKVTVCAGVRKLSDAATAIVAELSPTTGANDGTFYLAAPVAASPTITFLTRGTAAGVAATFNNAAVAAPVTLVATGIGDISGDSAILRTNAVQRTVNNTDQGAGNYAAAQPLFVGRRGGTTLPFNGNLYGLVIRGGASTAPQIASLERYMAQKTGIPA